MWGGEGEGRGGGVGGWVCMGGWVSGGGGGGSDGVYATHVCPYATTRVQLVKLGWCQCTSLFG